MEPHVFASTTSVVVVIDVDVTALVVVAETVDDDEEDVAAGTSGRTDAAGGGPVVVDPDAGRFEGSGATDLRTRLCAAGFDFLDRAIAVGARSTGMVPAATNAKSRLNMRLPSQIGMPMG